MSFIDKSASVPDKEGSCAGRGEGDAMDPVLGQESSPCQPLTRIPINQEAI